MAEAGEVTDLIEFLRARLDEDEREANRAQPHQAPVQLRAMVTREGSAPFLVIDSARMLAEVATKRSHISRWAYVDSLIPESVGIVRNELLSVRRAYYNVLLDDARPYADHPDYRKEWRP